MNKSIIALACAVVLCGFFVQGAEARHHHWNNGYNRCNTNTSWFGGRHNGWRNRGYNNYNNYNSYNGYNNNNGWGNSYNNGYGSLGARMFNWR